MTFPYAYLLNYFLRCIYLVHAYLHKNNFTSFLVVSEFTLVITKDILRIMLFGTKTNVHVIQQLPS